LFKISLLFVAAIADGRRRFSATAAHLQANVAPGLPQ
jgi:hypothetical protein